jgi:outer membrane protein assembly factor BamA
MKYVPDNEILLDRVVIKTTKDCPPKHELSRYLRQEANGRFLGIVGLDLFWYNLSGQDTAKWINRTLKNMGEPPVFYEKSMTSRSILSMKSYMMSKGYYNATVDTLTKLKDRKLKLTYIVDGKKPYTIRNYTFKPSGDSVSILINENLDNTELKPGMPLSSERFDNERTRIVKHLQRQGYYYMNSDFFSFDVDSTIGNNQADVELILKPYNITYQTNQGDSIVNKSHPLFKINKVYIMLDVPISSLANNKTSIINSDTLQSQIIDIENYISYQKGNYSVVYPDKPFINPDVIIANCLIIPGEPYNARNVEKTYFRMNTMDIMKYVNIRFIPIESDTTTENNLECYIFLTPTLKQSFSLEVEGTNTAGDLGVAGNIGLTHRNAFHGAEMLQAKFRGAYEALSTSFQSDYTELGGELGLTFPDFKMPLLSNDFKKKVDAKTEFNFSYQNMSRPEFLRTVATTAIRYNWTKNTYRHTLDLIDLSYVYMPRVDSTFEAMYLTNNSYLKYSYENHFILRTAYSFSYSSIPLGSTERTYHTLRGSVESAGNSLYAIYSLTGIPKDDGYYKIGNIGFAQYLKGEAEFAKSLVISSRSRFAYRAGLGIAYPYGNSKILPFEKRFFLGGANSVRGWSVRTLGPGTYRNRSNGIDFMNQSGDIKFDLGFEYRSSLIGKIESALFADMGNIWTVREYSGQPGGQFDFKTFYKEIAGSVGLGLRIDFGFFLARLDLGMKVYDPSLDGRDKWRILSINSTDDFALHLAFGYPF